MRILYAILIFITAFSNGYNAYAADKNKIPSWVKELNFIEKDTSSENGAYQYLLMDYQDNLEDETYYRHFAIKLYNSEGVQSFSDLSISYDPSFQEFAFHKVSIIRNGKSIDKLATAKIETIQREKGMDRSLYDGSLTAIINLEDVRPGDILEYSYSKTGWNPINKGAYSQVFYHEYNVPVNRIYNRIITPNNKSLYVKLFEGANEGIIISKEGLREYIWDEEALEIQLYDNNVPDWYDAQKRVNVSTYENWEEVVNWALQLYQYDEKEAKQISSQITSANQEEDRILDYIRYVQDEIRYLGFESGIGAYKPNNPIKVFDQKYGDCKDKSLLLVSLLREENIEAYPLLVNSGLYSTIDTRLASHHVFNHCVVNFEYQGVQYFVDPTISQQGGDLEHLYFPNYGMGLRIKAGESELISIPTNRLPSVLIEENIQVDSIGGGAYLRIKTTYKGTKADYFRSRFESSSLESIQESYLDYYSSLYASIEIENDIRFEDKSRLSQNEFIVIEEYYIPEFWFESDNDGYLYCETYPLVLESIINYPNSSKRSMPYYTGRPQEYRQITTMEMPEEWVILEEERKVAGGGYNYQFNVRNGNTDKIVEIENYYKLTKDYIPADSTEAFLTAHDDLRSNLSYYLSYNQNFEESNYSWISYLIAIIALVISIYLALRLNKLYNPAELTISPENLGIGGWLVLPAIGLTISPFIFIFSFFDAGFFDAQFWTGLFYSEEDYVLSLALITIGELIINIFFIIYIILLVYQFYTKRTSLPLLISIFYVANFIIPLLDLLALELYIPEELHASSDTNDIIRAFISGLIWIPYFNISERVKNTFSNRL